MFLFIIGENYFFEVNLQMLYPTLLRKQKIFENMLAAFLFSQG